MPHDLESPMLVVEGERSAGLDLRLSLENNQASESVATAITSEVDQRLTTGFEDLGGISSVECPGALAEKSVPAPMRGDGHSPLRSPSRVELQAAAQERSLKNTQCQWTSWQILWFRGSVRESCLPSGARTQRRNWPCDGPFMLKVLDTESTTRRFREGPTSPSAENARRSSSMVVFGTVALNTTGARSPGLIFGTPSSAPIGRDEKQSDSCWRPRIGRPLKFGSARSWPIRQRARRDSLKTNRESVKRDGRTLRT